MKAISFLSISMLFTVISMLAQTPFQKSYYLPGGEMLFSGYWPKVIRQTFDQGYLVYGSRGVTFESANTYLLKTDSAGNTSWSLTIGEGDNPASFFETSDGGFFITGSYYVPFLGAVRTFVVRTDAQGDTLWGKMYGKTGLSGTHIYCNAMCRTSDGNYVLTGATDIVSNSDNDAYLMKMDTAGNPLWVKVISSSGYDSGYDIKQTADGGFVFIGTPSFLIAKTDQSGNLVWTKSYSNIGASSFEITADNGFIMAGNIFSSISYKNDASCIKTDSAGNVIWAKVFGDSLSNDIGGNVLQTPDGGYIMPISVIDSVKSVLMLLKMDGSGNILWTKTVADSVSPSGYPSISFTNDGGYVITAGKSLVPLLIKTDSLGNGVNCNTTGYSIAVRNVIPTPNSLSFSQSNTSVPLLLNDVYQYHTALVDSNISCQAGLVWPGDANADGIANNQDLLSVGIAYGFTGTPRPNATTNWLGQPCPDWVDTFSNGVNYKHADCNGEGIVDSNDVSVISLNYGLTHAKRSSSQRMINSDLFLVFPQDTFETGDTVTGTINLGTAANPVNNIYGIAFSLTYNQNIIDSGSIRVDFTNSWVAPASRVSLAKDVFAASRVDIGHSRSDHNNVSGSGVLADISFVIQDNIDGKDYFVLPLEIQFEDVMAIDKDEAAVNITSNGDTLYVEGETTGIEAIIQKYNVRIFPNPAANEINVVADVAIIEYSIMDIAGRKVLREMSSLEEMTSFTIDLSGLEKGSYLIQLKTADHYSICRKVVVCR